MGRERRRDLPRASSPNSNNHAPSLPPEVRPTFKKEKKEKISYQHPRLANVSGGRKKDSPSDTV